MNDYLKFWSDFFYEEAKNGRITLRSSFRLRKCIHKYEMLFQNDCEGKY